MLKAVAIAYGLTCLSLLAIRLSIEGNTRYKPKARFWRLVDSDRLILFNLTKPPPDLPNYEHAIMRLSSGIKCHYIRSSKKEKDPENLLILFHGFPDTHRLWTRLLNNLPASLTENCTVIVPDLPGFGGSEEPADFGPDTVMNTITEFVLRIREECLPQKNSNGGGRVVIAGHDWGSILSARLVTDLQAAKLADHFILICAGSPAYLARNVEHRRKLFRAHLTASKQELTRFSINAPTRAYFHLSRACMAISPVVTQLIKSYYVFMFNVPKPFLPLLRVGKDCFMRIMASLATAGAPDVSSPSNGSSSDKSDISITNKDQDKEAIRARHYAGFQGPHKTLLDLPPSAASESNIQYGDLVRHRVQHGGALITAVRLYREGLLTDPWHMEGLDVDIATRLAALPDEHVQARDEAVKKSSLSSEEAECAPKAPTTLIWADDDIAQDARIIVDGVETDGSDVQEQELRGFDAWLPRGVGKNGKVIGGVIRTSGLGHWLPVTKGGVDLIVGVVQDSFALWE